MGRELRRVPIDFDWPVGKIWAGFENPYYQYCSDCPDCGLSGYNPETRKLSESFYVWSKNITQDEVDMLVEKGRLIDFVKTGRPVTADWVNAESQHRMVHACRSRHHLIEFRAGEAYGYCSTCKGSVQIWYPKEAELWADDWEPHDPPEGDAYQIWETTSEGSALTPPFATPHELARHCADTGVSSFASMTATYEQWMKFIEGPGWAPSCIIENGVIHSGVEFDH
jgi:hypothetical protein